MPALYYRNRRKCHERCRFRHVTSFRIPLFRSSTMKLLGSGGQILSRVAAIDTTAVHPALSEASFTIACDVDNPFYGPRGATRIFAGQKGATPEMTEHLEAGMQAIAAVIAQTTGKDIGRIPGSRSSRRSRRSFSGFYECRLMSGLT